MHTVYSTFKLADYMKSVSMISVKFHPVLLMKLTEILYMYNGIQQSSIPCVYLCVLVFVNSAVH